MLETGKDWAPTKKLVAVMDKIVSLMVAPNLDSPLNQEAAKDYSNGSWQAKAKQITQQYAKWYVEIMSINFINQNVFKN